jgi:hypothetical protein
MPFKPSDTTIYVPDQIRQQGETIAGNAQQLASNTKTFWQYFQQAYQKMPQAVQKKLKSFEDTSQPDLDELLKQRIAIGHLLSGTASHVEQVDAQIYSYYERVPTTP